MLNQEYVIRNVNDLYECALENETTLLPTNRYDFWQDYVTNHTYYDRMFRRMYINYYYFDQDISGENPVFSVLKEFKDAVEDLFWLRHDDYDELYKIMEASLAMEINPFNDYSMVESEEGTDGYTREYVSGERTDESSKTTPAITKTTLNEKYAFNSTQFIDDTRTTESNLEFTETSEFTKGEQTDTEEKSGSTTLDKTVSGTKTSPYENLEKANKYWDKYKFYEKIFADICREFLLSE